MRKPLTVALGMALFACLPAWGQKPETIIKIGFLAPLSGASAS